MQAIAIKSRVLYALHIKGNGVKSACHTREWDPKQCIYVSVTQASAIEEQGVICACMSASAIKSTTLYTLVVQAGGIKSKVLYALVMQACVIRRSLLHSCPRLSSAAGEGIFYCGKTKLAKSHGRSKSWVLIRPVTQTCAN